MSFKINALYLTDGYKVGHKAMLAPGTTKLYGTWIPRSTKHAPKGIKKIVSFGQQMAWRWIHDEFEENFFYTVAKQNCNEYNRETIHHGLKQKALQFVKDMSAYLGMEYDGKHFEELWDLGYLPIKVKALPEGIETGTNIPHMTFVNTVDGFAWLTLYLETIVSSLAWKPSTAATIAKLYRRQAEEWVAKTDPSNMWLVDYMCHDFSARGLDPMSQYLIGLGHATSFKGSDTLPVVPAARYFYNRKLEDGLYESTQTDNSHPGCYGYFKVKNGKITGVGEERTREGGWFGGSIESQIQQLKEWPNLYQLAKDAFEYQSVCINSVNASEHSVSTTKIFTVGEQQMIADWLKIFDKGILSIVADTFDLWKLITEYLPANKDAIMARDGKLVIRPDSGDPVDIICGLNSKEEKWNDIKWENIQNPNLKKEHPSYKGVIELLWDIFGGTINDQGYKVLDPHIGAIYGDSITPERQRQIYERLEAKGFAATNIVLGVGSFTYQFNTRDTLGFAAKGAWFEVMEYQKDENGELLPAQRIGYNIYKDPVTDDGTKKSLKGMIQVEEHASGEILVFEEATPEMESRGLLQVIYEDGKFYNQTTLSEVRERLSKI